MRYTKHEKIQGLDVMDPFWDLKIRKYADACIQLIPYKLCVVWLVKLHALYMYVLGRPVYKLALHYVACIHACIAVP
jgi:hypothetical protein